MDEITKSLRLARNHYDNAPVWNKFDLEYSGNYRYGRLVDHVGYAVVLGRLRDNKLASLENTAILYKFPR